MDMDGFEIKDGVLDLSESSVRTIENKQFLSQKHLRYVILPVCIEHIGDWAFAKCRNLKSVKFKGVFRKGLFGKEVFRECDELSEIVFADTDDDTSQLLALCTNRLPYDHLLRSEDIGQKSWYEKWDISLMSALAVDDAAYEIAAALCGEEDISYDGIGSVDGEMPGETEDIVRSAQFDKCRLCYIRLQLDRYLPDDHRRKIEKYIYDNRFGENGGASFYSVFGEGEKAAGYLEIYLDIVRPDRDILKEMISAVPAGNVFERSYLIGRSNSDDVISDLLL